MKRIALSTALTAALAAVVLAATAQARLAPPDGGALQELGTITIPGPSSGVEKAGTATGDGTSITVTDANGGSITCAVPAGLDVSSFLGSQVKAECEVVDGVLTVKEIEGNGAKVEVNDDGTVDVQGQDDDAGDVGDDAGDDNGVDSSGSTKVSSGSGDSGSHDGEDGGGHDGHGGSGGGGGGGDD